MSTANSPLSNLNIDNDAFGSIHKSKVIHIFLESNLDKLDDYKMIALYGEWGTGKTTLLQHLSNHLNKEIFYPIFFETWQHEKDDNLSLSLSDAIQNELPDGLKEKYGKPFLSFCKSFLKGLSKSSSIRVGIPTIFGIPIPDNIGPNYTFSGKEFINELAEKENKELSYFEERKIFKEKFREIEAKLIESQKIKKEGRLIVFIDDLDRCEPENLLNLLAGIKLFFTLGTRTTFILGLDKDAVRKAVKLKYQDIIKSSEYLEKIFDITFHMPQNFSLDKLMNIYFTGDFSNAIKNGKQAILISEFFKEIGFVNPRHIKKVLNKYTLLQHYKKLDAYNQEIPDIFHEEGGEYFDTIMVIIFIILYDFYPKLFEVLQQHEKKASEINRIVQFQDKQNTKTPIRNISILNTAFAICKEMRFNKLSEELNTGNSTSDIQQKADHIGILSFFLLFLPIEELSEQKEILAFKNQNLVENLLNQFNDFSPREMVHFCFLINNLFKTKEAVSKSHFTINRLISMANYFF